MMFRYLSRGLLASALLLHSMHTNAEDAAEDSAFLNDTYTLWLGGFFPGLDSEIRLDPEAGTPGDGIDFEDGLGLADGKSVLFGGFKWRPSLRHLIEFEYIQLNRAGQVSGISETLIIGDYEIRVGGDIQSVFNVAIGRFTYGYDLAPNSDIAFNLKAGLHLSSFDTVLQLSGAVFQDDMIVGDPTTVVEQTGNITAPLPHFGLSYGQEISPTIAVRAQALLFKIKYDGYEGTLLDFGADIQYRPWETFGLGAGVRYFRTTVEDNNDDGLRGRFLFEYVGPVIYGTWSF